MNIIPMINSSTPSTPSTPQSWREALDKLDYPKEVIMAAARIIWWDYFADQESVERWNHLDDLLKYEDSPIDDDQLAMALVKTGGYTLEEAKKRV